jgi:hypothetical protein
MAWILFKNTAAIKYVTTKTRKLNETTSIVHLTKEIILYKESFKQLELEQRLVITSQILNVDFVNASLYHMWHMQQKAFVDDCIVSIKSSIELSYLLL